MDDEQQEGVHNYRPLEHRQQCYPMNTGKQQLYGKLR
jgi:hypothetical protein